MNLFEIWVTADYKISLVKDRIYKQKLKLKKKFHDKYIQPRINEGIKIQKLNPIWDAMSEAETMLYKFHPERITVNSKEFLDYYKIYFKMAINQEAENGDIA